MKISEIWMLTVACWALSPIADAQCASSELLAPDAAAGDGFGAAVALENEVLVIGAPHHDLPFAEGGAVYVFERSGGAWSWTASLFPQDGAAGDLFGSAVAIGGGRIAVASSQANAIGSTQNSGVVYLFERATSGWVQTARLLPTPWMSAGEDQTFGEVVCLSGDTLAIRSSYRRNGGVGELYGLGLVYVRVGTSWSFEFRSDEYAVRALALDGDRLASGYTGQGEAFIVTGAVRLHHRSGTTWSAEDVLSVTPPSAGRQDFFGASIALDGERMLVGATVDQVADGSAPGTAYIFSRATGTWLQEARLESSDGGWNDRFGDSVALEGARAAVGAQQHGQGAVYLFEYDGTSWSEVAELSPGAGSNLHFPSSLALDGGILAAGSAGADSPLVDGGATLVHELATCVSHYCTALANSTGSPARIGLVGDLGLASNDTWLTASDCPPGQMGAFFYGANQAQLPFGDGYLCVSPAGGIIRLWPPLVIGRDGSALRRLDFQNLPPAGPISAGSTWFFQFWYRDPAALGSGFNTSDGLEARFRS